MERDLPRAPFLAPQALCHAAGGGIDDVYVCSARAAATNGAALRVDGEWFAHRLTEGKSVRSQFAVNLESA